jgi:hypothetical protein
MISYRATFLLTTLLAVAACTPQPFVKGHLRADQVDLLMQQGVVASFFAGHRGSTILLDNGDIFSVDLPPSDKIFKYLEQRRHLGKQADFQME